MTTFPALIPSTRTYSPGEYPHTPHPLLSGSEIRVRHSNVVIGCRLRLAFTAASSADVVAVRNHYNDRQGGFLPFAIPDDLLSGVTTPADFTPAGHQWRYASRPRVVDVPIAGTPPTNRHDLVIELESSPAEGVIVSGARITVRATVRGGSAELGAYIESFASVVGGAATVEASTAALGASITAGISVSGGSASGDDFVDPLLAQASVIGGVASASDADPGFASVSLLLHMDGTNGSTTFTDSSSNSFTIAVTSAAQISTAQSRFGGASGDFTTAGHLRPPSNAAFTLDGDFTIELFVRRTGSTGTVDTALSASSENAFMIRASSDNPGIFVVNNNNICNTISFTQDVWHHIAVVRSGTSFKAFKDGVDVTTGTFSSGATITMGSIYIGRSSVSGRNYIGYIDELRITKGVARYTADFTPPSAPFPDS
jgi:hypothetical protein